MHKQPSLVTAAVIINKDKILLVKRAREPFKGRWSFVGGKGAFEDTSNPLTAVKQEVRADLNCEFHPKFFTYYHENFGKPTVTLFFYGNIEGKPKITPKYVSECRWFLIKEIKDLNLAFEHKEIFKELQKEVLLA